MVKKYFLQLNESAFITNFIVQIFPNTEKFFWRV